jgi:hypothetical protein
MIDLSQSIGIGTLGETNEGAGDLSIENIRYVASSATFTGTADGTFNKPFATIQDAINFYGVPTTQAEYLQNNIIEVIDSSVYTGNLLFPTGIWTLSFPNATIVGNVEWEVDNAERFGSTNQCQLSLIRNTNTITTGLTGNITVRRKAGGTAVSLGTLRLTGFNSNAVITMADGTNGGDIAFTQGVISMNTYGLSGSAQILARTAFMSFVESGYNPTTSIECGSISFIRNTIVNSLDISEYINTTTTRTIRGLTLNSSGGVTYRAIGSARNWNVDVVSGSEVLTKITSYPNNALNLIKPVAGAVGIQDAGGYFTATDVEDALQELGANTESGTYTPTLTNVTNINASTVYPFMYTRVGNTVIVAGKVDFDPTTTGTTELGITLPIASNFANDYDCVGTTVGESGNVFDDAGWIKADITNDRAALFSTATIGSTGNHTHWANFTYQVI